MTVKLPDGYTEEQFRCVESAVAIVMAAIDTTKHRIDEGYIPEVHGNELLRVVTREYLDLASCDGVINPIPLQCTPDYIKLD